MAVKDLTFLLFAKDMNVKESFDGVSRSADRMGAGVKGALGGMALAAGAAAVAFAAHSVKMAADFQSASTRLVTDAGESQKALGMVQQGMLDISATTGTSADEVAKGMYYIESAGYHAADGLKVMHAAAEGAKVGGAELKTVADALTTVMKDYGLGADKATNTTSELIATVSRGKTTMEDLAGSLHSVLPNAEALHIPLADILGALATMTQEGISADQATQNLNHAIVSLASPTHAQAQEMAAMGLNATKVAADLGKRGLTGTMNDLVAAITSHMGPAGLVLQKSFTNSQLAAQSANTMYKALPGPVKTLATAYMNGSISLKTWTTAVKGLTPAQANLAKQWAATESASRGFSQQLKSGSGAAQTFTAAMAKMTGGQTGLQVALHITGLHARDTADNVKAIGEAARGTQKDVSDWAKTQSTFNQQSAEFNQTLNKMTIQIGGALLPTMTMFARNGVTDLNAMGVGFKAIGQWWDGMVKSWAGGAHAAGGFISDMVAKFQDGARQIRGAFAGAGTWLYDAGRSTVEGLVSGIQSAEQDVVAAATSVASLIPSGVRQFLNINSPSKVMIPIGRSVGEGLQVGLLGSADQVKSAASDLAGAVVTRFKDGAIGKATENAALASVSRMSARLQALSRQRDAVNATLSTLRGDRQTLASGVKASTIGAGDVTGYTSSGGAIEGLEALVTKTKRFKYDLYRLWHKGVSGPLFAQLVQGWQNNPDNAIRTADELLANPMDLKQIMSLQGQLSSAASALGIYAGNAEYGRQVNTAAGQSRVLTWEMQKTAYNGLRSVERQVHVHVTVNGHYAGTKDDLAKTLVTAVRDAVRRGAIPKNAFTTL